MNDQDRANTDAIDHDRNEFLHLYDRWTDLPLLVLGLAWLALLVIDLIGKSNPILNAVVNLIWVIFIIDFAIRFILAPQKIAYFKNNWLTVISLALPAMRIFTVFRALRILQVARATRSLNLVRVIGSLNRGMRTLQNNFGQRILGYVMALTIIVLFVGAAGVFAFENGSPGGTGYENYGEALWWTAMMMTTLGANPMPQTAEGRLLALLISLYAIAVFGYVTATLASIFIGQSAVPQDNSGQNQQIQDLQNEVKALRAEIKGLAGVTGAGDTPKAPEQEKEKE